jgi:predicted nucleic acid-binding protein
MTTTPVVIDANVLVALTDAHDKWHPVAVTLRDALLAVNAPLVYFDCVVNEAIGVIGRRAEEQKRSDQFGSLLDELASLVPATQITWISAAGQRLYEQVLRLCRDHGGRLNFNDALMALVCREFDLGWIISFDGDFDEVEWLSRVADLSGVQRLGQPS